MSIASLKFEGCVRQDDNEPHVCLVGLTDDVEEFRIFLNAKAVRDVHRLLSAELEDTKKFAALKSGGRDRDRQR